MIATQRGVFLPLLIAIAFLTGLLPRPAHPCVPPPPPQLPRWEVGAPMTGAITLPSWLQSFPYIYKDALVNLSCTITDPDKRIAADGSVTYPLDTQKAGSPAYPHWSCTAGSFPGGYGGTNVTWQAPSLPGPVTLAVYGDDAAVIPAGESPTRDDGTDVLLDQKAITVCDTTTIWEPGAKPMMVVRYSFGGTSYDATGKTLNCFQNIPGLDPFSGEVGVDMDKRYQWMTKISQYSLLGEYRDDEWGAVQKEMTQDNRVRVYATDIAGASPKGDDGMVEAFATPRLFSLAITGDAVIAGENRDNHEYTIQTALPDTDVVSYVWSAPPAPLVVVGVPTGKTLTVKSAAHMLQPEVSGSITCTITYKVLSGVAQPTASATTPAFNVTVTAPRFIWTASPTDLAAGTIRVKYSDTQTESDEEYADHPVVKTPPGSIVELVPLGGYDDDKVNIPIPDGERNTYEQAFPKQVPDGTAQWINLDNDKKVKVDPISPVGSIIDRLDGKFHAGPNWAPGYVRDTVIAKLDDALDSAADRYVPYAPVTSTSTRDDSIKTASRSVRVQFPRSVTPIGQTSVVAMGMGFAQMYFYQVKDQEADPLNGVTLYERVNLETCAVTHAQYGDAHHMGASAFANDLLSALFALVGLNLETNIDITRTGHAVTQTATVGGESKDGVFADIYGTGYLAQSGSVDFHYAMAKRQDYRPQYGQFNPGFDAAENTCRDTKWVKPVSVGSNVSQKWIEIHRSNLQDIMIKACAHRNKAPFLTEDPSSSYDYDCIAGQGPP